MKLICYFILLQILSCTTLDKPEITVDSEHPNVRILKLPAVKYNLQLDSKLRKASDTLCPHGYDLLESSFTPSLMINEKDSNYYYWVIDCPLDTNWN